jgi:hypothetical protein
VWLLLHDVCPFRWWYGRFDGGGNENSEIGSSLWWRGVTAQPLTCRMSTSTPTVCPCGTSLTADFRLQSGPEIVVSRRQGRLLKAKMTL